SRRAWCLSAFDLLHLDGQDLRFTPPLRRRELLQALLGGGGGNDTFRFTSRNDSLPTSPDIIRDFDDYGNDGIALRAIYGGVVAYIHDAAFSAGGRVRINDTRERCDGRGEHGWNARGRPCDQAIPHQPCQYGFGRFLAMRASPLHRRFARTHRHL